MNEMLPLEPAAAIGMDSPQRFFNRELSWLGFNMRVLEEARNRNHPLLERLRFLSISGNNLDEFFMVRVAGLVGQVREQMVEISPDGLSPEEQLEKIRKFAQELMAEQDRRWLQLKSELTENGITIVNEEHLTADEHKWLDNRFLEHILPIVTPIAI
ncbi:MAG TPA: RNA degradosome polyphosphate kinase, partial [Aestuariivirga sp.]|nr:RNA degradosome polyphosphate kinase [Aestuariivirga sp.]